MINDTIELKGIIWEDFVNYKKPCMTLMFPKCDFKCDKENGVTLCQNRELAAAPSQTVHLNYLFHKYKDNPITEAIVLQGLEPLDSPVELCTVAAVLRELNIKDDLVIYTGYNKSEILLPKLLDQINPLGKLIIKWGRYIPNQTPHEDPILGVMLSSDNQYAEVYNEN